MAPPSRSAFDTSRATTGLSRAIDALNSG